MKLKTSLLLTLLFTCTMAYATEYCPDTLTVVNGTFMPPSGWYITMQDFPAAASKESNYPMTFYIATYNFDHKVGENDKRISCYYTGGTMMERSALEITTSQRNFASPMVAGTKWESAGPGGYGCGGDYSSRASDCGWTAQ